MQGQSSDAASSPPMMSGLATWLAETPASGLIGWVGMGDGVGFGGVWFTEICVIDNGVGNWLASSTDVWACVLQVANQVTVSRIMPALLSRDNGLFPCLYFRRAISFYPFL